MRDPISHRRRSQEAKEEAEIRVSSSSPFPSKSVAYTGKSALGWSEKSVWTFALAFRAANALLTQTYFNPDEHWQSLEVAHRVVFGYGHLTWEWKKGIRSYLHPLLFALLYKVLAILRLDTPWFMANAPRLLQSFFASTGDLYTYKLSKLIFDEDVARWTFFCQMTNWFMFFCITRTLSNSLETVLTLMGLFYWLSSSGSGKHFYATSRKLGLFIAAAACAVRPTSAITWLYIGLLDLFRKQSRLQFLFLEVVPIGIIVLALSGLLDWWMYGSFIIVPLNFLRFNFLSSGGDYYGTHKWHWYLTQGFPAMLFTFIPYSLMGIIKSKEWKISGLIAWVIGVYSLLGHKEFRFVLPVLPIALIFCGYSLAVMAKMDHLDRDRRKLNKYPSRVPLAVLFLLVTNVPMALYMSLVHQVSDTKGILDESDQFMMDPPGFVLSMFKNTSLPSHIVLFSSEERQLFEVLTSYSFAEVKRFFHAHFKVDREHQAYVSVYARPYI